MQESEEYEDSDGKCAGADKGCNDLVERIKIKKKKQPIWSTRDLLSNQELGNSLANWSTYLQHGATIFSSLGAGSEIGFTAAGLLGGTAAVGWADLGLPIADVTGGLAGGLVGWEVGHHIHVAITNPIESFLSTASARTTYVSDILLGNTRLDLYADKAALVVGQPTATSGALAIAGRFTRNGMGDAAIDTIGSLYSAGKIGGVYDQLGITGNSMPLSVMNPLLNIQFGDQK